MEEIRRTVAVARRRLILQQYSDVLPWALLLAFVVSVIGLAIPKFVVLTVSDAVWIGGWMGGGSVAGLLIAMLWTFVVRRPAMDAALEVDRRFGLKERVSSALSLSAEERESDAGQALLRDTAKRIDGIDVKAKFAVSSSWRSLLPLVPAAIALALFFVDDAQDKVKAATSSTADAEKQIDKSMEELKARLAKQREKVTDSGLKDAEELFKKLQQGIDELHKDGEVDKQKAMIKINDLAKELDERRKELGDLDKMQEQLEGLKNIEKGPADKIVDAMKEGNFEKAMENVKQLQDKLASGELTPEEKQQLTKQLEQLKEKMEEMANNQREAKEELKQQIAQKEREGDLEGAGQLQRQLDELERQDAQMERMEQMASQLGQAAEAMKNGDSKTASQQLSQFGDQLQEMQAEMAQLESLDEMMDEIADAKDAMNCDKCGGEGCESCQGNMGQFGQGQNMDQFGFGNGLGEGRGAGYRPEQETETGVYESKVRGNPKAGEAVRIGDAIGPNKAGVTHESSKEAILSAVKNDADPLTDQRLPKDQQAHVKEYYQRLNDGE